MGGTTAASMVAGTLYTYPENFRAQKGLIAAKYSGAQVTLAKDFVFGETNKSPEFLKKFPLGKVPAFEGTDGLLLTESNAIAYYLANEELRGGKDEAARAQVMQWMCMADSDILPAACTWVFPTLGIMQFNKNATDRAKEDIKVALKTLNDHLLTRTFLVGERVTLADISVACTLLSLYKQVLDPAFRGSFTNVNRWFTTVINQPNAKAVLGEVVLCTKMAEFDSKKFAEFSGKGDKKKEAKPKAEPAKKKEPEKKKEKEAEPEEEPLAPAEPKKTNPMDALPKGTFDLEEWKRFYSNKRMTQLNGSGSTSTTRTTPSGRQTISTILNSPWCSCPAILLEECFQRLEKMKKHAFASSILFGENNNSSISGIWVWRGHELAFDLCEDWAIDSPSYEWKKLDSKSEECKKLVTQYWKWEGEDAEGRKFNQGKILK